MSAPAASQSWVARAVGERLFPLGDLIAVESLRSLRGGWPQEMLDAAEHGPEDLADYLMARVPGARLLANGSVLVWRHRWHGGGPRGPVWIERGHDLVPSAVLALRNAEWWETRTAAEVAAECLLSVRAVEGFAPMPADEAEAFRAAIIAHRADGPRLGACDYAYLPGNAPAYILTGRDDLPSDALRFIPPPEAPQVEPDPWEAAVECFLDLLRRHVLPVGDLLDLGSLEGAQGTGWPEPLRRVGLKKLPKVALAALDRLAALGNPVFKLADGPTTWATRWEWLAGSGEPRCILLPERGPRTVYALRNAAQWRDGGWPEAMALDVLAVAETDLRPISDHDKRAWRYERSKAPMFSPSSPWRTPIARLLVEHPEDALDFFGPEAAEALADLVELRESRRREARIRHLKAEHRRLSGRTYGGRRVDETPEVARSRRQEAEAALAEMGETPDLPPRTVLSGYRSPARGDVAEPLVSRARAAGGEP